MRLAVEDAELFLAVIPAFIASLPPALWEGPGLEKSPVKFRLANSVTALRFETQQLSRSFTVERARCDLPDKDALDKAAVALRQILAFLENLIDESIPNPPTDVATVTGSRPKLENLRNSSEPSRWIRYKATSYDEVDEAMKEFRRFNIAMGSVFGSLLIDPEQPITEIFQSPSQPQNASSDLAPDEEADELRRSRQIRDSAQALMELVASSNASCDPPHLAMIHLTGFHEKIEIDTIISLCGKGTANEIKWHHVQCLGAADKHQHLERKDSICSELKNKRQMKMPLRIKLGRDKSWKRLDSKRLSKHATAPAKPLRQLLFPCAEMPGGEGGPKKLERPERVEFAEVVARSLLCLFGTPLLREPWNSDAIFIAGADSGGGGAPMRAKLYTSCALSGDILRPGLVQSLAKSCVLHLGVLLCELFFERKIEIKDVDKESDDDDDEVSLYNALSQEEEDCKKLAWDPFYVRILSKCLELYATDLYGPPEKHDDALFWADMYRGVVKPLSLLRSSARPRTSQPPAEARTAPRPHQLGTPYVPALPPLPPITYQPVSASNSFFATQGSINDSASWLQAFDAIKMKLDQLPRGHAAAKPVRVAILDTGCDLSHGFFNGPGIRQVKRVERGWLDMVEEGSSGPVDEDPERHGTALVALLLRLLPKTAELHVIRIAKDVNGLSDARAIADAIRRAVEERKADIVSMSFGLEAEKAEITSAIDKRKRIFFAAANNHGQNGPEMFPASYEAVISVRGTLPDGSPFPLYCPNTWPHIKDRMYGTLACDVCCGWIAGSLVKSGCSVATPIMAAIAATIISFVDCQLTDAEKQDIRTKRGMMLVFEAMTRNQRVEPYYISPWPWFHDIERAKKRIQGALADLPERD